MRIGGARTAPQAETLKPAAAVSPLGDIHVSPRYVAAMLTGIVMSGAGAGLWLGIGAGLFWAGLLLVLVPYSATVIFMRMTLDAFGPRARPDYEEGP